MSVVFISITGTQTLALLNPIQAIIEQHQAPDHIYLLSTPYVKKQFSRIFESMKSIPELSSSQLTIYPISQDLKPDADGNPPPHILLTQILDRHSEDVIVFNMTSGLKFQIISCIKAIGDRDTLQVYAERGGIHVFKMWKGLFVDHKRVPLPKPMNILNLQGISYARSGKKQREDIFSRSVSNLSMQLNKLISRIPTWSNIEIEGILFNLVWNDGNTLSFLARISSQNEAKNLISVASNRHRFFELYHRNIFAFSNDKQVIERLDNDGSSNKISVRFYSSQTELDELLDRLRPDYSTTGATAPSISGHKVERAEQRKNNLIDKIRKNIVLIAMLAPNEVPTLISIFSHCPEKAILFYTADNQKVCQVKDQMLKNISLLPVKELQFVPVSFIAKEILNLPSFPEMNVEVNLGPGHKVAGFFLYMWATANNGKLFSINNDTNQIEQITGGESLTCQGPRPEVILELAGKKVTCGMKEDALMEKQETYQTMLSFIGLIKDNHELRKIFPENSIDLRPKAEYTVAVSPNSQKKSAIIEMSGHKIQFQITGGQWFEELVGYQFLRAGADAVSVRVRVSWSDAAQSVLESRYEHVTHRNDIDVIARFKGKYFMISCKSGNKSGVGKECELAEFHANTVAHFAVPMVCFLRHNAIPSQISKMKPCVFGHQTFLNPELLRELCEQAYRARQTTRNQSE
jgi:hypothetical protein